jgi:hypothetical protein
MPLLRCNGQGDALSDPITSEELVTIDRATLDQLYRIERAARAFVEADPRISVRCSALWDDFLTALYDGTRVTR